MINMLGRVITIYYDLKDPNVSACCFIFRFHSVVPVKLQKKKKKKKESYIVCIVVFVILKSFISSSKFCTHDR